MTWNKISFQPIDQYSSPSKIKISSAEKLFIQGSPNGRIYRFNGTSYSSITNGSDFNLDFEVPYNKPNLFILNHNGKLMLQVSEDTSGSVFIERPVPITFNQFDYAKIKFDYLDNLILYNSKEVWISGDDGITWKNITPLNSDLTSINDIDVDHDNFLYLATTGTNILKTKNPLSTPIELNIIVYNDENGNCTQDENETTLPGIKVNLDTINSKFSNNEGEVSFLILPGTYSYYTDLRSDLYSKCNSTSILEVESGDIIETQKIGATKIESCVDLCVATAISNVEHCTLNNFTFEIFNDGSEDATNVTLTIDLDEDYNYLYSDFEFINENGSEVTFNIGDIPARTSKRGNIDCSLNCLIPIGETHCISSSLSFDNPCNNLIQASSSYDCFKSFETTDKSTKKSVVINGIVDKLIISPDAQIEYLINFTNLGWHTANDIQIFDLLDPHFDINSVEILASSHDLEWSIRNNIISFSFNEIQLPGDNSNELESSGFVKFGIKLLDEKPEYGEKINNTAKIIFNRDNSDQVVTTNTVNSYYICQNKNKLSIITICSGDEYEGYTESGIYVEELISENGCDSIRTLKLTVDEDPDCEGVTSDTKDSPSLQFTLYPNPTRGYLNIVGSEYKNNLTYQILTPLGVNIKQGPLNLENAIINLNMLPTGLYLVYIIDQNETVFIDKIYKD